MIRFFLLLVFCFVFTTIQSQSLQVMSVSPVNQKIDAEANAAIIIDLDQAVDPNTVNSASVKVFGRWSGPATGTFSFENANKRIIFQASEPFFAGEWITVSLTLHIKTLDGVGMDTGYSWNYWIATAPGSLQQSLLETIELRLPGEGLLQSYGAYAGDLNNDGYSDLTVINETSDDLRILLNDGDGNYSDFTTLPMGTLTPSPNEGADFNNDGEIDLAVSTAWDNEVRVLMGDGAGSFTSPTNYTTGNGARGLVVLDCNGDGHDDIFITNRLSDNLSLLTNVGDGTFSIETLNTDGDGETAAAVADANNDGIPDIFIGMYNSRQLGILIGDGQGGFTLSGVVTTVGRPWMIAAGDMNGDGNADVVSANSNGNLSVVAFGNGQGDLVNVTNYTPPNSNFPLAIDLGDLDGDGDLDMITSNYSSGNYTVYENDGDGGLSVADYLNSPNLASCAILHDRDGDGDLDIAVTDEGDDVLLLFDNPGIIDAVNELPEAVNALEVFPNPSAGQVQIQYELEQASEILIAIYHLNGQEVLQLERAQRAAGTHTLLWDGANTQGQKLPLGTYILTLKTDLGQSTRKVTLK